MSTPEEHLYANTEIPLPRWIRFCLLLGFQVPALICSIFILYHLLRDRDLRHSVNNHTVIVLNVFIFILLSVDIPMYLNFISLGQVSPATPIYCLFWWIFDIGIYYSCCCLAAWASIERHILVFHSTWLTTTKGRFLAHYLPLTILVLYLMIYYIWLMFFPSCEHTFNYQLPVCGALPCYFLDPFLSRWEFGFHGCATTLIIIAFSLGLLLRILYQKKTLRQQMRWHKYRRLTWQLLSISLLFSIFNLPFTVMFLAEILGLPADAGAEVKLHFFFLCYWVPFFTPFVCLNSVPNWRQKVRALVCVTCQHPSIAPAPSMAPPTTNMKRGGIQSLGKTTALV